MGELYGNPQLTGKERFFDDIIVSKTDLEGKITYANRTFMEIAGFPDDNACIGQPHNVIRHPNMPRAVFLLLWKTLQSDQEIFAYVINRALNGDHYWVLAHVTPSHDMNNNVIGYHSNRRVPNKAILNEHIIPLYKNLLSIEKSSTSPKAGMEKAFQAVVDLLTESKLGYNEFIFSLGV
jgi:PAS domain S-box-containing protein